MNRFKCFISLFEFNKIHFQINQKKMLINIKKEKNLCFNFFSWIILINWKSKSYPNLLNNDNKNSSILNIAYNFIPFICENSSFSQKKIDEYSIYFIIIIPKNIKNIFVIIIFCFSLFIEYLWDKVFIKRKGILIIWKIRLLNSNKFE